MRTKDSAEDEEDAEHSTSLFFVATAFVIVVAARGRRAMVMRPLQLRGAIATAASGLVERAEAGERACASSAGREAARESMLMERIETSFFVRFIFKKVFFVFFQLQKVFAIALSSKGARSSFFFSLSFTSAGRQSPPLLLKQQEQHPEQQQQQQQQQQRGQRKTPRRQTPQRERRRQEQQRCRKGCSTSSEAGTEEQQQYLLQQQ